MNTPTIKKARKTYYVGVRFEDPDLTPAVTEAIAPKSPFTTIVHRDVCERTGRKRAIIKVLAERASVAIMLVTRDYPGIGLDGVRWLSTRDKSARWESIERAITEAVDGYEQLEAAIDCQKIDRKTV